MTIVEIANWAYLKIYVPKFEGNKDKAHEDYDKFVRWVVRASKGAS